jgi:hypothetical protein
MRRADMLKAAARIPTKPGDALEGEIPVITGSGDEGGSELEREDPAR